MKAPLTRAEVAKNNTADSLWCIIDHNVYDLTDFIDAHPGGSVVLTQVGGTDATAAFYNLHRQEVLTKFSALCIGTIDGETPEVINTAPGELSSVPYAEPLWLREPAHSPYFNASHRALQKEMRLFTDNEVYAEAQEKEKDGSYISQKLINRMAETGILAMRLGPGPHLFGQTFLNGAVRGEEFDYFHDLVVAQEMVRANARGFQDGNMAGMVISLTAVRQFLNDKVLKERITKECLSGKKKICLAISEAFAGSDVAGIRTTATKSADGSHYIVSGTKKWITNGMFADYFVTGCRTPKGFSVLLIDRADPGNGTTTTPIKTSYSPSAATAYIEFDNVKVPANRLLGVEHKGFAVIMHNFNHERWTMTCAVIRQCRTVVEECLKWATQRQVFGQPLISQPVIRNKLAGMISRAEALQAWLEQITLQMNVLHHTAPGGSIASLGGPIALLKSHATREAGLIASDAVNIFGGRGITPSGMGRTIEMFHRTYKFDAILGGAEEVLMDLAVRQVMKTMPKAML